MPYPTVAVTLIAAAGGIAIVALERTRRHARVAASRWAAAAQVSQMLSEAADPPAALPDVLRTLAPSFSDWAAVHLADASGVRRAAMVHRDRSLERAFQAFYDRVPFDNTADQGPARVFRTGEAELFSDVPAPVAAAPDDLRDQTAAFGWRSWMVVPLKARRQTVGTLTVGRMAARRPFAPEDLAHAQDIGHRIGLALENARLFAEARELFEQTITANFVSTPDGRFLACNQNFANLLGFATTDEVLALPAHASYAEPERREAFLAELRGKRRLVGYENTIRRPDGRVVAVVENVVGTFDERGELVRMTGFIADRTAERDLEEQLRQAQRLEAIGQLAGGIAHDFNNLLTVIIGCVDLLRSDRGDDPPDRHDPLEEIAKAARRAAALTQQLLAFSRRQVLQPRTLDLNESLRNLESMLRRIVRDDVTIAMELDPALRAVRVDPGQLDQMIVNLVVNASDAIPHAGTISLVTGNATVDPAATPPRPFVRPGSYAWVEVRDTGVGMDEATRARVFEPFFTTKPVGKGTGLGLSTVYGIVKQSGGYIWVTSAPGSGTTITVYLPAVA